MPLRIYKSKFYLVTVALVLLNSFVFYRGNIWASEADSTKYNLPEFMVTATRVGSVDSKLPYAISVVEIEEKDAIHPNLSVEEILRDVPGILVDNRNNLSQGDRISSRGLGVRAQFGVRGIKVLLDDIPLTTADGQTQLNSIDLSGVGRVEVIRGPVAALYGNASGGLISIKTRNLEDHTFRIAPRVTIGSYGLQRLQLQMSKADLNTRSIFNTYSLKSDGYRHHSYTQQYGMSILHSRRFSSNLTVRVMANVFDGPFMYNPSSLDFLTSKDSPKSVRSYVIKQGAAKQIRQSQMGNVVNYISADSSLYQLTSYVLSRSLLNPIPGRIIDLNRISGGLRFSRETVWNKLTHITGLDTEWQNDKRVEYRNLGSNEDKIGNVTDQTIFSYLRYGERQLNQEEDVVAVGVFSSLNVDISSSLSASIGIRFDRSNYRVFDKLREDGDDSGNRHLGEWSRFLGLNYRPHSQFRFFVNYGTSFQNPTTTELSNRVDGKGGFNPDLNAERVNSLELGGALANVLRNWHVDWSVYRMKMEDMLIPFQTDNADSEETFFRNVGVALNRGIEWIIKYKPTRYFGLQYAYTYSNFEFVDYTLNQVQLSGNRVPGLPPHRTYASANYYFNSKFYVSVDWETVSRYYANDNNGPLVYGADEEYNYVNRGYSRTDLRLSYSLAKGQIFVGLNNIFNVRYNGSIVPNAFANRFFEPAAGRVLFLGLKRT